MESSLLSSSPYFDASQPGTFEGIFGCQIGVSSDERPETLVHILRCTAPDDKESFVSTSLLLLRNPVVTEYFQDMLLTTALAPRRCKTTLSIIKVFLTFGGDLSPSSFTHLLSVCYLEHQIVHLSSVI